MKRLLIILVLMAIVPSAFSQVAPKKAQRKLHTDTVYINYSLDPSRAFKIEEPTTDSLVQKGFSRYMTWMDVTLDNLFVIHSLPVEKITEEEADKYEGQPINMIPLDYYLYADETWGKVKNSSPLVIILHLSGGDISNGHKPENTYYKVTVDRIFVAPTLPPPNSFYESDSRYFVQRVKELDQRTKEIGGANHDK